MIIVTGAAGQLGSDVVRELERRGTEHMGIDIAELDITDKDAVEEFFKSRFPAEGECRQDLHCVIHCAAYTAVDKAEDEPELCFKINAGGTENLAKACRSTGAEMIYISTDYVFDGMGKPPLETDAAKNPLSVYGKSKLAGETAVQENLDKYYIVRIAWAFGQGGPNFVKTMLRLAETRSEISVVDDQFGSPTYTADLAKLLCDMALSEKYGVYHATNEGFCSWAEFAGEIMRLAGKNVKINRITTEEYPVKATRPKVSCLSKNSLEAAGFKKLPIWQDALERYMKDSIQQSK